VTVHRRERLFAATALVLVVVTWATLYWARFVSEWFRARGWLTALLVAVFAAAALGVGWAVARSRPRPAEIAVLAVFAGLYAAVMLPLVGRVEEALHFVQYGAVGGFAYAALAERRRRLVAGDRPPGAAAAPAAGAFLFTTGAGWIDEGIQHLLPNRYYDLRDVLFNATGGALAIAAMAALGWARRRGRPRPEAHPPA
jgi:VanZ family protein